MQEQPKASPFGAAGWALCGERRRQNPSVWKEESLIFGQKSGILDSVSYKRTIYWFSFFVLNGPHSPPLLRQTLVKVPR
jgi:hypothetical protein